jgi:hypothetical protein
VSTRSCQIAIALRPRERPLSIAWRCATQALAEGLRPGWGSLDSCSKPVVTSMAGFGGGYPHPPGGRTTMPASLR